MKNKKILLLLIPFLASCNAGGVTSSNESTSQETSSEVLSEQTSVENASSEEVSVEEPASEGFSEDVYVLDLVSALNSFSKGIKVDVQLNEKYGNNENTYRLVNTSKNKEFSFVQYKGEEKVLHEYYASSNDDEFIYQTRLNVANEYNYYKVYNPVTYDFYKWSDGYDNVFSSLTEDSFTFENSLYSLKEEALKLASPYLSTLLYGNPGLDVTSFVVGNEGLDIKISATAKFEGSTTYDYTFAASVVSYGEKVEMDYKDVPYSEVKDEVFEKMISDLKGNNYTARITNDDGFDLVESVFYSNEDKVYYETSEYHAGFYVNEENLIQEVKKEGEDFYKVSSPMEGNISEVMPSFNVSRAVFDEKDGIYTLKDKVEGEMSSFIVLEAFADTLDELEIRVTENGYEVKNTYDDCLTTVEFVDIGSTEVGFNKDTVLEPVLSVTWDSVLDEDSYNLLVDIAGEYASLIPVPEGYDTWYQLSEEPEYVFFASEAKETTDDDIYAYALALMEAGFILSEEEGMNGGIMGLMEVSIDGTTSVLVVEFLPYYGSFAILVYIGE